MGFPVGDATMIDDARWGLAKGGERERQRLEGRTLTSTSRFYRRHRRRR